MSNQQLNYSYEEQRLVYPWSKYPWRKSYVVWTIIGLTLLGFLMVNTNPNLYAILALSSGSKFHIWQLLSACFVQNSFFTIVGVLILQLFWGIPLEHEWSRRDLALAYLLSGIGSNLVLWLIVPQITFFASPLGIVAGLLALGWRHLPNNDVNLFMVMKIGLRTLIVVIMVIIVALCLMSQPIVAVIPITGFALGIIYCLGEKLLQRREATSSKLVKNRISNIEID
jgi:membrane associated rhomboid family serine protease